MPGIVVQPTSFWMRWQSTNSRNATESGGRFLWTSRRKRIRYSLYRCIVFLRVCIKKEEENKEIVNLFDEESFTFLVLYCTSN